LESGLAPLFWEYRHTMQRNATAGDEFGDLSPVMEQVVVALVAGSTVTKAAEAAGVDRTTVHRWLRDNWTFQAALNRARREFRDGVRSHLEKVAERAVQTVSEAVEAGDVRAALGVLKGLGFLAGHVTAVGLGDPEALRDEAESAREEAEAERRLRALTAFS
jgi:hypothetical protein